ncbi:hypothetical protein POSPLADRAFT_1035227 [Postia placenta MAD-698-R-SB12]|uniref:Uncharacterized protein n=1 Tax=Postia placenta MAD-698-R-SB12 TaxID=670580 RepID=A0A1X6MTD3_9APHY|nr:hypothetical protein POSPLADRAFT_1035227 [Postia placenta MAD-698-R-SB12]OSX59625.1 hypothetical protein POSPLADRAFT_1035227 [Postia placenta MAD-698-R-SB12]
MAADPMMLTQHNTESDWGVTEIDNMTSIQDITNENITDSSGSVLETPWPHKRPRISITPEPQAAHETDFHDIHPAKIPKTNGHSRLAEKSLPVKQGRTATNRQAHIARQAINMLMETWPFKLYQLPEPPNQVSTHKTKLCNWGPYHQQWNPTQAPLPLLVVFQEAMMFLTALGPICA